MEDPLVAELAYRETVAARSRTRAIQRAIALPLRLLAVVDLVGAVVVLVVGQYHLLAYFGPAFLCVFAISFWWYRRYARLRGLLFPVWPWIAIIGLSLLIGANVSHEGMLSDRQWLSDAGPPLIMAASIAVVAIWLRSTRLALTAMAMAASTGVVSSVAEGDVAISIQLIIFAGLLWYGSGEPEAKGSV